MTVVAAYPYRHGQRVREVAINEKVDHRVQTMVDGLREVLTSVFEFSNLLGSNAPGRLPASSPHGRLSWRFRPPSRAFTV